MSQASFYRATVLADDGQLLRRTFFLASARDVRLEVALSGQALQELQELNHGAWWQREVYTGDYKREFLRSVMFYVETGISPSEALLRVMLAERNERKRAEFASSIAILRAGGRFAQAIEHTGMFDPTLMLLLQAAEVIGMRKVVPALEALMAARAKLQKFIGMVASVLSLELFTAVSASVAIKFYGLPYIAKSFQGGSSNPSPAEAAAAKAMTEKLGHVGLYNDVMLVLAMLVTAAAVVGAAAWFTSPVGRERVANLLRHVPGGKALLYHASLADGFSVAASMLNSGITLSTVLNTLAMSTRNPPVRTYWMQCATRIRQGLPVAAALADASVLGEAEIVALNAHRNMEQLARVAQAISERRAHAAELARLRLVKVSTLVTVAYIGAVIGAAVWMLLVQDEGMGMMMKAVG